MEALAPVVRVLDAPDAAEVRLEKLARAGAPVRRVLAALAGQLVASKAWDRLGYVRPRDYVVERLGLSSRQVQDLAHVDRALSGLPQIDAASVAGDLPGRRLGCCVGPQPWRTRTPAWISRSA